jgi:phosphotransferase system  glucose/maltose/N-acetylglucosamine-specific IIC component
MKRFIIQSTVLTIIVFTLGAVVYSTFLQPYYLPILPIAVLFFYLVTNLVHAYLLKIAGKSGSRFTSQYMAVSFLKMFFYLTVGIVYAFLNKESAKLFLGNFLVLYAVYTTFEVLQFSKFVRQKKI